VGRFKYEKNQYKKIGLIAGGTGLTPCLQVIRCILEGPEGEGDNTQFVLFFQNRTEADILLKEELSALADMYPDRLRVLFFLSNPSESSWGQEFDTSRALKAYFNKPSKGSIPQVKGYISKEAVKAAMSFRDCPLVGICGPSGFNESMKQLLLNEGHDDQSIYIW
jgi:ferredoxin-NADP reductase